VIPVRKKPQRALRPEKKIFLCALCGLCGFFSIVAPAAQPRTIQFVFTSDAHYGIVRPHFRGHDNVEAHIVNAALVEAINRVGPLDFVAEGGDLANREEVTEAGSIQSAAASWAEFQSDYIDGLTVKTAAGRKAPLYVVPGNHEVSNAIGFYKPMRPLVDKTALVEIYNRMMAPSRPKTDATYDYGRDRVLFAHTLGGIHFVFITIWPDSIVRAWMENELAHVDRQTPVVLFAHDQPEAQAKHFSNPNGAHDINAQDKFENLLSERLADGTTIEAPTLAEQRELEGFLGRHRNITAYFHGNSNWNEFYDWHGPRHSVTLHAFRVDSPMKGAMSEADETRLSFQVATIDTQTRTLTVRECLWNRSPEHPSAPIAWGESRSVSLLPSSDSQTSAGR
jgi:calcineurin-like phosphoesterase family protein